MLYPTFKGRCDPTTGSPASARQLSLSPEGATQCSEPDTTASGRRNEMYKLSQKIPGILPSRSIRGEIAFDHHVADRETSGFVDATIRLSVNDEQVMTASGAGVVSEDQPYVVAFDVPVPRELYGASVRSVGLLVEWNPGTSPGIEPMMDGTSFVKMPLDITPSGDAPLQARFSSRATRGREGGQANCPEGASGCIYLVGQGWSPAFGSLRFRRIMFVRLGNEECFSRTKGTLFFLSVDRKDAKASFESRWARCGPPGLSRYDNHTFKIEFKGGVGVYRNVQGSATIRDTPQDPGEVWKGRLQITK